MTRLRGFSRSWGPSSVVPFIIKGPRVAPSDAQRAPRRGVEEIETSVKRAFNVAVHVSASRARRFSGLYWGVERESTIFY